MLKEALTDCGYYYPEESYLYEPTIKNIGKSQLGQFILKKYGQKYGQNVIAMLAKMFYDTDDIINLIEHKKIVTLYELLQYILQTDTINYKHIDYTSWSYQEGEEIEISKDTVAIIPFVAADGGYCDYVENKCCISLDEHINTLKNRFETDIDGVSFLILYFWLYEEDDLGSEYNI